jgi:uncharacterized protein
MNDYRSYFSLYDKSPLVQLIISVFIVLIFGMLLLTLMFLAGTFIFGIDAETLSVNLLAGGGEVNINFLRYLVFMQDICLFVIPALVILVLLKSEYNKSALDLRLPRINEFGLVIVLAFCVFPVTSFTGVLNSGIHLPDWLSEAEKWMVEKESDADKLINLLIVSDTFWIMMLNMLIIALLPAISEELIFRGVFQKILYGFFKSGHPAIWLTAIIFSVLHFQFFGLIPRFILGLVFGYLYFWSRTLWLPVFAHFINNAVPVLLEYIKGTDYSTSQQDVALWQQAIGLPVPIIAGTLILWYFRNKSKEDSSRDLNQSGVTKV